MEVRDAVGNLLEEGDSVIATKTLDVKGSNIKLKKGEKIKNIRLTDDPNEVEVRIGKSQIVLKTQYFKKA